MRDAWVAPTRAEAERVYGPEVMDAYKYYWRNGLNEFRQYTEESQINIDNLGTDRLILGEPQEVVDEFHRWKEATGADYFLLRLRHAHSGGPPHERIMEAIQLLGEEVIPALPVAPKTNGPTIRRVHHASFPHRVPGCRATGTS